MTHSTLRNIALAAALGLATPFFVAACSSTPTSESGGQYADDATITTKVKAAFVTDKTVSATDIKVDTYKGVVQLSGFASSQAEINQAVQVAKNVSGVVSVKNDIALKASTSR